MFLNSGSGQWLVVEVRTRMPSHGSDTLASSPLFTATRHSPLPLTKNPCASELPWHGASCPRS